MCARTIDARTNRTPLSSLTRIPTLPVGRLGRGRLRDCGCRSEASFYEQALDVAWKVRRTKRIDCFARATPVLGVSRVSSFFEQRKRHEERYARILIDSLVGVHRDDHRATVALLGPDAQK